MTKKIDKINGLISSTKHFYKNKIGLFSWNVRRTEHHKNIYRKENSTNLYLEEQNIFGTISLLRK